MIELTKAWRSCGQEAATPRRDWLSSRARVSRFSIRRTSWLEACKAGSCIIHGATVVWPMVLRPPLCVRTRRMPRSPRPPAWGRPVLSESESKRLLAAWGVVSAREVLVASADAAVEAAEQLGFPVALKIDSPDILHKTEAGVVRLNLRDAAQVRSAYSEILAGAKAHAPQAEISGVSVQEMVADGVEVIVGVSCDPQLGPVLLFGSGGMLLWSKSTTMWPCGAAPSRPSKHRR